METRRISLLRLHWLLFRPTFLSSLFGALGILGILQSLLQEEYRQSSKPLALAIVVGTLALTTLLQLLYNQVRYMGPLLDFFESDSDRRRSWTPERLGPLRNVLIQFPLQISRISFAMWGLAGLMIAGLAMAFPDRITVGLTTVAVFLIAVLVGGAIAAPFHYGLLKRSMQQLRYLISADVPNLHFREERLLIRTETKLGLAMMSIFIGGVFALGTVSFGLFKNLMREQLLQVAEAHLSELADRLGERAIEIADLRSLDVRIDPERAPLEALYVFLYDAALEEPVRSSWSREIRERTGLSEKRVTDLRRALAEKHEQLLTERRLVTPQYILSIQTDPRLQHLELVAASPRYDRRIFNHLFVPYLVFLITALAMVWLLARFLYNDIIQPQRHMARITGRVAEGELQEEANLITDDEVGQFAFNLTTMIRRLRGIVGRIVSAQEQVEQVAQEIRGASGEMLEGSRGQARSVQQIHRLVHTISDETRSIAAGADSLQHAADQNAGLIDRQNASLEGLSRSAMQLVGLLEDTGKAVDHIAASIVRVAQAADAMAESVSETAASVNQMSAGLTGVSESTREMARLSGKVEQDAEEGRENTRAGSQGMTELRDKVHRARAVVAQLGEKAQAVGMISTVINSIAEQTNLLALNASVIASQAGEHGRGFAVIAGEIRNLSVSTKSSAQDIGNLIEDVQEEINSAVAIIHAAGDHVEDGVRLADRSERALEKIRESTQRSRRMSEQVRAATQEQAEGLTGIQRRIETMVDGSGETRRQAAEIRRQAESIQANHRRMSDNADATRSALKGQTQVSGQMADAVQGMGEKIRGIHEMLQRLVRGHDQIAEQLDGLLQIAQQAEGRAGRLEGSFERLTESSDSMRKAVQNFRV